MQLTNFKLAYYVKNLLACLVNKDFGNDIIFRCNQHWGLNLRLSLRLISAKSNLANI